MELLNLTPLELLMLVSGIGLIVGLLLIVVRMEAPTDVKAGTAIVLTLLPWPILRGVFSSGTTGVISFAALGAAIVAFLAANPLTERRIPGPVLAALVLLAVIVGHTVLSQVGGLPGNEDFLPQLIVFWFAGLVAAWALSAVEIHRNEALISGIAFLGVITAILTILVRTELDQSHIELGRTTSFALLVLILHRPRGWSGAARWGAAGLVAFGALASGSRAGLLFAVASVLFVWFIQYGMRGDVLSIARIALTTIVSLTVMVAALPYLIDTLRAEGTAREDIFVERQSELLSFDALLTSQSTLARTDRLFASAMDQMQANRVFGRGLIAGVEPESGEYTYAHNMVLEMGAGMGYIGLALGALIVSAAVIAIMTLARRGKILLAGAATYWLLAAQVSGNLAINRYGFLFVLIACTELACDRHRVATDGDDAQEDGEAAPLDPVDDGAGSDAHVGADEGRLFDSPLSLIDR